MKKPINNKHIPSDHEIFYRIFNRLEVERIAEEKELGINSRSHKSHANSHAVKH